jgi:hypothetical protein
MPNTKAHPQGCVFMFRTFSATAMDAKHENHPVVDGFCVQRLFCHRDAFPSPPMHAEQKSTDLVCFCVPAAFR